MKYYDNQNGRSMVEMLGVLAIVAVLSVGGIAGYSKAMAKFKIGKTLDQIQTLVTDIRSLYSGSPDYAGISITNLITHEVIPNDMRAKFGPFTRAKNAFGGHVEVSTWNGNPSITAQGFQFSYNRLDQTSCIQLATADWGGSAASGFVGLFVNPYSVAQVGFNILPDISWANGNLPLNLSDAAALCTSNNDNSITWIYR